MNNSVLIIVPPENNCINNCPYCIIKMFNNKYENLLNNTNNINQYINQLNKIALNGCKKIAFTGVNEPLQNKEFLQLFANCNKKLNYPFTEIELQTSGVLLDENYIKFLKNELKVSLIALSINSIDDDINNKLHGNNKLTINLKNICNIIKQYNIKIRFCYNLLDTFNNLLPIDYINFAKTLNADEILFRQMYSDHNNTIQSIYVDKHQLNNNKIQDIYNFVSSNKINGYTLFNTPIYNINDIKVTCEIDKKSQHDSKNTKNYFILRTNCKLYDDWNSTKEIML